LAAVADGLTANGVVHHIEGDDLIVEGGAGHVKGGGMVATISYKCSVNVHARAQSLETRARSSAVVGET
jgi:agmatine/peptidylarginine deiminase